MTKVPKAWHAQGPVARGQRWRFQGHEIIGAVDYITPSGIVVFDPSPKLCAPYRVSFEALLRDGTRIEEEGRQEIGNAVTIRRRPEVA